MEHVIGVAGPELGNFRGGLMASATSAPFALVAGGLSATLAVATVAATNASLRAYRTPRTPNNRHSEEPCGGPSSGTADVALKCDGSETR